MRKREINAGDSYASMGRGSGGASWQRLMSRQSQFLLDILVLVLAFVVSYELRFDFAVPSVATEILLVQLPLVVLFQFGAMHVFGIYSFIWRYIGMAEVAAFIKAAWWSFLPLLVLHPVYMYRCVQTVVRPGNWLSFLFSRV